MLLGTKEGCRESLKLINYNIYGFYFDILKLGLHNNLLLKKT
jgi:hypothetical protein